MPASLMQVAQKKENQKHEFYEEEMEQAKVGNIQMALKHNTKAQT